MSGGAVGNNSGFATHPQQQVDLDDGGAPILDLDDCGSVVSTDNTATVASHYNARGNLQEDQRKKSPIANLRKFNNWVKQALIRRYTKPSMSALDICGGKGGDLKKWNSVGVSQLVLCDVAHKSIEDALERIVLCKMQARTYLVSADCFLTDINSLLPPFVAFDVVSCQFALHYSFESEEKVRGLLCNVTTRLKPGGFFFGTIPDANVLVKKLRNTPDPAALSFGNSVFRVEFERKDHFPQFGAKYVFTLADAVASVPEYLVHLPTLRMIAKEYSLELVSWESFPCMWNKYQNSEFGASAMYVSPHEWEAIHLYGAFVFRKLETTSPPPVPSHPSHIITLHNKMFEDYD